jgi:hypothetical protein
MIAMGIGCFWFASLQSERDEAFEPSEHLAQIRRALESVDNVSDVRINAEHAAYRLDDTSEYDSENFFPMHVNVEILFHIYLPKRVQETYGRGRFVVGGIENFNVCISYGYEFLVTYITYDMTEDEDERMADASTAIMIIREYLSAKLILLRQKFASSGVNFRDTLKKRCVEGTGHERGPTGTVWCLCRGACGGDRARGSNGAVTGLLPGLAAAGRA